MRTHPLLLSLAGLALVGACGRGSDSHQDDALKNDLALAAQAQSYTPSQFTSHSIAHEALGRLWSQRWFVWQLSQCAE
jgi:hypothetical protein